MKIYDDKPTSTQPPKPTGYNLGKDGYIIGVTMNDPAHIPVYSLDLARHIAALERRIARLERRSGLMSRSWFTRAYTVWFYAIAAQALVAVVVLVVLAIAFG
jgi:hypothetical protein